MNNRFGSAIFRSAAIGALAAMTLTPSLLRAADHGDAPNVASDLGADIADIFLFLDPLDQTKLVLIGTVHGFIVPGEAPNFAVFDPTIRYRFEIYNDHVNMEVPSATDRAATTKYLNRIKPNRTIDVTFSPRVGLADATAGANKDLLQIAQPQQVTLSFGGFAGISSKTKFTDGKRVGDIVSSKISTTNPTLALDNPPAQQVYDLDLGPGPLRFFAGEVDDPFFFDIPAFNSFVASARSGMPNTNGFSRGRDTFAGYNILAIAFELPVSLLKGTANETNDIIGVDFLTQRHAMQFPPNKAGVAKAAGTFKTVDRVGNPGVNPLLLPFNRKNEYNAGTPKDDAKGRYATDIAGVIQQFGLGTSSESLKALADIAITKGDLVKIDVTKLNMGPNGGDNPGVGFPNGRRLKDDTVDIVLTAINNGTPTGDNVDASDPLPTSAFPFVAPPNQPRSRGGTFPAPDTNLDDKTRN